MASINDTAATGALNEDKYINKVYDSVIDKQKNLLKENYTAAGTALDAEKQSVQQQTNTNLGRVNVEAQKIQQAYKGPKLSVAAQQQAALSMDNQQKKNTTTMNTAQSEADTEIERQRKLLGEQYTAAIKKAQADNDMARAQMLYDAAKAEDAQLLALRQEAGTRLAAMGDNSVVNSLLQGGNPTRDTTSETWDEVRNRESDINKIYDSALESDKQAAQMVLNEALAKIEAEQAAETAATDRNLTQIYVNALKNAKNYDEVQSAYGIGSGTLAQAKLARALGLADDLAGQRGVQMGNAAKRGQQRYAAGQVYRDAVANSLEATENKRAKELYKAAEEEEQALVSTQKSVGEALAKQGDYSVLKKLWGLNQDQTDRLQGAGTYAPRNPGSRDDDYYERENSKDTTTGTHEGIDPSIEDLGYGPISKQELASKIESGEVTAIETDEGTKFFKNDTTPGSSAGAAIEAAIANGGKPVFVPAKQDESVIDKIVNAISNIKAPSNNSSNRVIGGGSFGSSGKDNSAYWNTQKSSGSSNSSTKSTSSTTSSSSKSSSSSGILGKVANAIKSWIK